MVWGGITANGRTDLVILNENLTARRYIDEVLQPHLLPFLTQHGGDLTFQQDNAPAHRALATRQFFMNHQISLLTPWPAKFPDLNVIEHLWDRMKRDISALGPPPRTVQQLQRAVINSWNTIPQHVIQALVRSMRRRCNAVIDAVGSYTQY